MKKKYTKKVAIGFLVLAFLLLIRGAPFCDNVKVSSKETGIAFVEIIDNVLYFVFFLGMSFWAWKKASSETDEKGNDESDG